MKKESDINVNVLRRFYMNFGVWKQNCKIFRQIIYEI